MSVLDKENRVDLLERKELSYELDQVCPPDVYLKLMIAYLLDDKLVFAKFLWLRIPDNTKKENPILGRVWKIGKALYLKEYDEIQPTFEGEWPEDIKSYIMTIQETSRSKMIDLITRSYESISIGKFAKFTGMTEEKSIEYALSQQDWKCEDGYIFPVERPEVKESLKPKLEKIGQLADLIGSLEK